MTQHTSAKTPPSGDATAAEALAPDGSRRALRVKSEQIQTLFRQYPIIFPATVFAAAFLVAMMFDQVPNPWLYGWLLALLANFIFRTIVYLQYRRASAPLENADYWARRFTLGTCTTGCIWGIAGIIAFVPGSIPYQMLLIAFLVGVVSGSMTLTGYAPAFYSFVIPATLPSILRLAWEGDSIHLLMAVGVLAFVIVVLAFGRNLSMLTAASLAARYENIDLIEALTLEKAQAERARQGAEAANQAKSRFLAAASHDLRQPLHALALFSAALSEKARYPEIRTLVTNINKSVESLENLFNELLDISKLDAGVVQPSLANFSLQIVFDRLRTDYELEAGEKGLRFRIVPTAASVFSDPTLLERILRNLVSNAVRYTNRGGILIGCRQRNCSVRVDVCDTGIGIAESERDKIFEEFYQVDNPERDRGKGLGLGLAIVSRLEQLLGYRITLRSRPGLGSIFSVEVPRSSSAIARPGEGLAESGRPEKLKDSFIVVVDDERSVREGMQELLSQWGCQVLAAGSAEEALAGLYGVKRLPDLIIADYRLRAGLTGIEAIKRIRSALGTQTSGILITGDTAPDRLREAIASGYHLMHKPVSPPKLQLLLGTLLSSRESIAAAQSSL